MPDVSKEMNEIYIDDQTEGEDENINGVARFKGGDWVWEDEDYILHLIENIREKIKELYNRILRDFDVDISLNGWCVEDGWLDYSIEGKQGDEAFGFWCKRNDIELPCPEYP